MRVKGNQMRVKGNQMRVKGNQMRVKGNSILTLSCYIVIILINFGKGRKMIQLKEKKGVEMIFVKEPYEFVKGKYNLSTLTLKVLSYLFTKIDPFEDKEFKKYTITVTEISNDLNIQYANVYKYIKNVFRELMRVSLELEDKDTWKGFNIIVDPTIIKNDGTIYFYISSNLLDLLKRSQHYLKYNISVLVYFNSSYSIRLYKILRDRIEVNTKYKLEPWEIEINTIIELLKIPYSRYSNIKQKVLNKALEEINKYSDIQVNYEEIKKGRKVEKLRFFIEKKDNKLLPEPNKEKEKKRETATSCNSINSLKDLRKEILTNYNNQDKYFIIENNNFAIKENLLFLNNKALSAVEALTWWNYIYKNKDKIKQLDPQETKKEVWKEWLEELNNIYKGKRTLLGIGGEYADVEIVSINGEDLENLQVKFKRFSNNKFYAAKYTLDGLKGLFN